MSEAFTVIYDGKDRKEWLRLRRLGIGGSDAAGVLNESPYSSAISVFVDKTQGEEDFDNEPMYWGRKLEAVIVEHFGQETIRDVKCDGRLLRSVEWPWMQVTLDAVQMDGSRMGFVEAKNTRFGFTEVPTHIWIQVQHQFAVTGWGFGSLAVLSQGCEFFWSDVKRNDEFILDTLVPRQKALWDAITAGGPIPSPDPTEATRDALKRLYPLDNGNAMTLDGEFSDLDQERQEIAAQLKYLEAQKLGIDNKFKAELGNATFGILPNGRKYTYKANKNGVRSLRAPKVLEG